MSLSSEAWAWGAIIVLLAARVALSLHDIRLPGLQQDETLFVNAATLRLPGVDVAHEFGGVPLMIYDYIGALKSWAYDPIFAVAGTTPTTIRLPAVIIACAGLTLVYPAVRGLVNRPVAILAFAALCFDNSVFWLTRDDVGPSAIEFFLKCAALFLAARFAGSPRLRWVALLLVVLALGVFNKLNFIWVVNAAVAISIVLAWMERPSLRHHRRLIATWVGGLVLIYGAWAAYSIANHIRSGFLQPWDLFEQGMRGTLAGTWFYNYALGSWSPPTVAVALVLALFACGAVASVAPGRTRSLPMAMVSLTTVVLAIQVLVTGAATAGWHYVSIYPFVSVGAAYGVYALATTLARGQHRWKLVLVCAGVVALTYDGVTMGRYMHALKRQPAFSAWTPSVYALSRDLQRNRDHVFTADWGIYGPLFALHPGRRFTDLAFALERPNPAQLKAVRRRVSSTPGPKLLITHPSTRLVFSAADRNLFAALGGHLHLVATVPGVRGVPVYDVYAYR